MRVGVMAMVSWLGMLAVAGAVRADGTEAVVSELLPVVDGDIWCVRPGVAVTYTAGELDVLVRPADSTVWYQVVTAATAGFNVSLERAADSSVFTTLGGALSVSARDVEQEPPWPPEPSESYRFVADRETSRRLDSVCGDGKATACEVVVYVDAGRGLERGRKGRTYYAALSDPRTLADRVPDSQPVYAESFSFFLAVECH